MSRNASCSGGWTLEAAEAVCGGDGLESADILDLLTHLVDKSLINTEHIEGGSLYHRLETIRQYARGKLFDTDEAAFLRDKHLVFFLQLAEHAEKELQSREQKKWLARLEAEHDNLRAALEWSLKSQPEFGLRIAAALRDFWDTHGHLTEGRKWLEAVLDATQHLPPIPSRVKAIFGAMWFAARQSEIDRWKTLLDEGLTLVQTIDDKWGIAQGLASRGLIKEYLDNDPDGAEVFYRKALEIGRELGDKLFIGQALGPLASCALKRYDYARAEGLFRESLALFRRVENEREIAGALWNLAEVALSRRDYESSRTFAEESLDLYRDLEDKHGIATALRTLSDAVLNQANIQQARMAAEQSVSIFRQLGDRGCLGVTLTALARHIHAQGDPGRAAEIAQEAVTILHEVGDKASEISAFDVSGRIALAQGELSKARQLFRDGLALQREIKDASQIPSLLEGLGNVLAMSSQTRDAILLLGAADALLEKISLVMLQAEYLEYNRSISLLHTQIDDASFQKIWDEGRGLAMEQAIELALKTVEEM